MPDGRRGLNRLLRAAGGVGQHGRAFRPDGGMSGAIASGDPRPVPEQTGEGGLANPFVRTLLDGCAGQRRAPLSPLGHRWQELAGVVAICACWALSLGVPGTMEAKLKG